jgi:dipeptidase E
MKLVLYSGYDERNTALDEHLVRMIGKARPRITYIPAMSSDAESEFEFFCENFGKYGFYDITVFHVDKPYSIHQAKAALNADMIYLSGGNTFHFLKAIRLNGFDKMLKTYAKRGGVIAGLSAGAILLTPSIATASYPEFDCDDNWVGLKDLKALGLAPFEFFPHFTAAREYNAELLLQSKKIKWPIYGAFDGSGIIIEDRKLIFIGSVTQFYRGQKFVINEA